jgi:hydroxyacylglutathione hydrolase
VAPGLWLLRGRPKHVFNAYVMGDVLVDARTRHAARSILRQVRSLSLRAHVLTHAHMDHMGSSHVLCETLSLPLFCGERDVSAAEVADDRDADSRPDIW